MMKRLWSVSVFLGILILTVPCFAQRDITLVWNANTEPDLAGYIVYQSERPSGGTWSDWIMVPGITASVLVPPTASPTYTVTVPNEDYDYAFVVTAIDTSGNESGAGNPAMYLIPPDCQGPSPPMGVSTQ